MFAASRRLQGSTRHRNQLTFQASAGASQTLKGEQNERPIRLTVSVPSREHTHRRESHAFSERCQGHEQTSSIERWRAQVDRLRSGVGADLSGEV